MTAAVRRLWKLTALLGYFHRELFLSCLRVAWDVLTPRHNARPGILAVPIDVRTDVSITVLATLVSLTPGSLSLDVSDDRRTLYVHAMFIDDVEDARAEIKSNMERRVREALE